MSRGSSEFVIQKDGKYAQEITVFGDVAETDCWVDDINQADTLYGDIHAKYVASKLGGKAVSIDSEYGNYDEE